MVFHPLVWGTHLILDGLLHFSIIFLDSWPKFPIRIILVLKFHVRFHFVIHPLVGALTSSLVTSRIFSWFSSILEQNFTSKIHLKTVNQWFWQYLLMVRSLRFLNSKLTCETCWCILKTHHRKNPYGAFSHAPHGIPSVSISRETTTHAKRQILAIVSRRVVPFQPLP